MHEIYTVKYGKAYLAANLVDIKRWYQYIYIYSPQLAIVPSEGASFIRLVHFVLAKWCHQPA